MIILNWIIGSMMDFSGVFGLAAFALLVLLLFMAAEKIIKLEKRNKELEKEVENGHANDQALASAEKEIKRLQKLKDVFVNEFEQERRRYNIERDLSMRRRELIETFARTPGKLCIQIKYDVVALYVRNEKNHFALCLLKEIPFDPQDSEDKEFAWRQAKELAEEIEKW